MSKSIFFDEKGDISKGAIMLIIGMAGLLIGTLVVGIFERDLIGGFVVSESLGNMSGTDGAVDSFSVSNQYSTQNTYMTFAVYNSTETSSQGGSAISSCSGTAPCYTANSETQTITINGTFVNGTGFSDSLTSDEVFVNYTRSTLGGGALTAGSQIARYVGTALTLLSVGLIVLGAGLILSYLTSWRR